MNRKEAKQIITEKLKAYRAIPYNELKNMIDSEPVILEAVGLSGNQYQIEIMAIWDDRSNGNIRIMANIDDGGLRAFFPLSDDFIISPSGEFVGG